VGLKKFLGFPKKFKTSKVKSVYHVGDILREFLGRNFVCCLRELKSKNIKTFSFKNLGFFQPW